MFLVQILLPLHDRARKLFARSAFEQVAAELTERFGGMTAYVNSPARGLWEDVAGHAERDDIIGAKTEWPR